MMIRLLLILFTVLFASSVNAANTSYYVSNTGNTDGGGSYTCDDAHTGTLATEPWCSITKVNSTIFASGDNVYFRSGGVWTGPRLLIDWDGTDGDRVVIGAYYMSGGSPVIGYNPNPVEGYDVRPIIQGNYNRDMSSTEPIYARDTFIGTSAAIPSTVSQALVSVDGDYVTVQNLYVRYSAGEGIDVLNDAAGRSDHHHAIIEHNHIYYTVGGYIIFERYTTLNTARHNTVGYNGQGVRNEDTTAAWPGGISGSNSDEMLIEGNFIYNSYGESINFFEKSDHGIARGNIIIAPRSGCVYMDGGSQNLVEQNMCIATDYNAGWEAGKKRDYINQYYPGYGGGINVNMEFANVGNAIDNVIRNNIIVNAVSGIEVKMSNDAANSATQYTVSARIYGNTIINPGNLGIIIGTAAMTDADFGTVEIMRNIVLNPSPRAEDGNVASNICKTYNITAAKLIVDDNLWETNPSSSVCDDADDEIGTPTFYTTDFTNYSDTVVPTKIEFEVQTGSLGKDTGGAITTSLASILNTTDFPQYALMADPCSTFDTTKMSYDFNCIARDANSEKGAVDGITDITPTVSVPAKIQIGSTSVATWTDENASYRIEGATATFTNTTANTIDVTASGAGAQELYQSWRACNCEMHYEFPIANATYKVILHFNEPYWGVTAGSCGARRFDINVEGTLFDEVDICTLAGAPNKALVYTVNSIAVTDGFLTVKLPKGTTGTDGTTILSGIEIQTATADTITVGSSAVSLEYTNNYPGTNAIDPIASCSATTSLETLTVSSIDDTLISSGAVELIDSVVYYTPANLSVTGAVGSFIATFSDGTDTATCTISLSFNAEKHNTAVRMRVGSGYALSWPGWTFCYFSAYAATPNFCNTTEQTTDASGYITATDSRFPEPDAEDGIVLFMTNKTQSGTPRLVPYGFTVPADINR